VLEGLRSRAGTMFAAAALVTTFLSSEAIAGSKRVFGDFEPYSLDGVVIGAFLGTALLTLLILFPFRFRFSISAGDMIAIVDEREAKGNPVSGTEAYREVALRLELLYDQNKRWIVFLLWCFRGAILGLVIEVAAWVALYWRTEIA
jgi:hypothetical protein